MQITTKILNGKVVQSMRKLGAAIPSALRENLTAVMEDARREAQAYPPAITTSKYHRTGKYFSSFKLSSRPGERVVLSSDAVQRGRHYTKYVGGNAAGEGQAAVHVERWAVIAKTVTNHLMKLTTGAKRIMTDIIRASGAGR